MVSMRESDELVNAAEMLNFRNQSRIHYDNQAFGGGVMLFLLNSDFQKLGKAIAREVEREGR